MKKTRAKDKAPKAEQTITAKIQVSVDEQQRLLLDAAVEAYRRASNFVSDFAFRNRDIRKQNLHDALYKELRDRFNLKSQMAESNLRTVTARYKAILENKGEWIKPVFAKGEYDLVWNRDYSIVKDRFSVNTLEDRVKLPFHSKGMEHYFDRTKYRFGTAKFVRKGAKYYLHIPVTYKIPECRTEDVKAVVGIDRGINFVMATYDGARSGFVKGHSIKQKRAHYKQLRTGLQRRGTPSSRRRLKAIGSRENRWMRNVNHQVSKALVEKYPEHTLFVLEDLTGIRSQTAHVRRKDRYVQVSWSFNDLEQKIRYKAERKGSMVVAVPPKYTSQRCPVCGHTEKENRDKCRHLFQCRVCGYRSNDDRSSAMNLYRMGLDWLAAESSKGAVAAGHDPAVRGAVSHPMM